MNRFASIWKQLVTAGAFLVGAGAAFVEVPPQDDAARPLAIFCVAALVSIGYAAMRRWDDKALLWRWAAVTVLCLAAALLAQFFYSTERAAYTATYSGQTHVVGADLTPAGQAYRARFPNKTNSDLLFDAGGNAARVWTEASIQSARHRLRYAYLLCAPLIGATVLASTHVAALTARRSRKKR
jgi:hypothetical protein